MKNWKNKIRQAEAALYMAMAVMLAVTGWMALKETAVFVSGGGAERERCIVIDAGHAGGK